MNLEESEIISILNRCFGANNQSILPPPSLPSPGPIEPPALSQILFSSPGANEPSIFASSESSLLSGLFRSSSASELAPPLPTYSPPAPSEPSQLLPTYLTGPWLGGATCLTPLYTKSRIFVSYHHHVDQAYYDAFSRYVSKNYDVLYDNSPERAKDSDDAEYIMRSLRENHITGSSCTIVLCGEEARWRKFVDWEIDVTLSMEHGLVAVLLPTHRLGDNGGAHKPDRLQDNIDSGYAVFITWQDIVRNGPNFVCEKVALANAKSKRLINNNRPRMLRNGTPPWERNPDTDLLSLFRRSDLFAK